MKFSASIFSFLKHLLIPHKGNDHKPHIFREHAVLSIISGSIFLLLASFTSYTVLRTTTYGSSVLSSVLVDLTNKSREENNLPALTRNIKLEQAATLKGKDLEERGYFAHYAPDGTSPWYWFSQVNYVFSYAGENLAINFRNSKAVKDAWMLSPKHKENILDKNYEDIGIATIHSNKEGLPYIFIVQMFGKEISPLIKEKESLTQEKANYSAILFDLSYYISKFYTFLATFLVALLLAMILIEFKKQHYRHILYALFLIISVLLCNFINSILL